MRIAAWCLLAGCLFGCVRGLSRVEAFDPQTTTVPPGVKIVTQPLSTNAKEVQVQLARDVCADGSCAYQLLGGARYADWSDCGAALAARANAAGGLDAQDAQCVVENASIRFALERGDGVANRLSVRTRDAEGKVSTEDFVVITQDDVAPPAPTNVQVIGSDGQVQVFWDAQPASFRVYYGTAPGKDGDFSALNGRLSAQGPSPVSVAPGATTLLLSNLPNGSPIYIGVTAFDGVNESEKRFPMDARRQFATPGEVSLRFLSETPLAAGLEARAVATDGDLIVLVSVDGAVANQPKTVVQTFDLRAPNAAIGTLSLSDDVSTSQGVCKWPTNRASDTLAAAPKDVKIFGRYAFIASGTGSVHVVDIGDPAAPKSALAPGSTARTKGCAYGFDIVWPYLLVADGTAVDSGSAFSDDTPGGVLQWIMSIDASERIVLDKVALGCADAGAQLDTVRAIRYIASGDFDFGRAFAVSGDAAVGFASVDNSSGSGFALGSCSGNSHALIHKGSGLRLLNEAPELISLRGPDGGGVGEIAVHADATADASGFDIDALRRVPSPLPAWAGATAGNLLFVGTAAGRGLDVIDMKTRQLAGVLGASEDVRGVAVSGPHVVLATTHTLTLAALHDPDVVLNAGTIVSLGQVAQRGLRAWGTTPGKENTQRYFQQSLADLSATPITPATGAADDVCYLADEFHGYLACANPQPGAESEAEHLRACFTTPRWGSPRWPPDCTAHADGALPDEISSIAGSGAELLTMSASGFRSALLLDVRQNPTTQWSASQILATSGAPVLGSAITTSARYAAVQTSAGETLIDRASRATPTSVRMHAGLQGAALGPRDLCGVVIQGGSATFACHALSDGAASESIPLGPTSCDQAALARSGDVVAITFVDTAHPQNGDEGVVLLDLKSRRQTRFPLDTTLPSIRIDGPYVYVACVLGTCQLKLRR